MYQLLSLSHCLCLITILVFFQACGSDDSGSLQEVSSEVEVLPDPSGYSPLTAQVNISTDFMVRIRLRVIGQHGEASDVVHEFPQLGTQFELPVLGLYADYNNQVELTFIDPNGNDLNSKTLEIKTNNLDFELPAISIDQPASDDDLSAFYLVNYFGFREVPFPQRPFIFDKFGDIRWYLFYKNHPTLSNLFYDVGLNRLQNGNWIMGDGNTEMLYEVDMYGNIVNSWDLQGFGFHHTVIEKPNGNFLVTVSDYSQATVEDVIIEIDRNTGELVNSWDLTQSLDASRRAWETNLANLDFDWFHANGIAYSPSDDAIIVSGRTQGVVKLSKDNEVIWILAPHKDWNQAGNGNLLAPTLLKPIDAQGNAITDPAVLDGSTNHPDFEWAWYQHAPALLPNGHLMLFDNGENRNYSNHTPYSRAVEYAIEEEQKTIQQVWDYGKERGPTNYSQIVSRADYWEEEDKVIFTPGAINENNDPQGKVIEIDRQSGMPVFEASIRPPQTFFIITFHNAQRIELY
ncbi:MAG: aryl-sulfate sulfotransferase [Bacteroidota bacterium]